MKNFKHSILLLFIVMATAFSANAKFGYGPKAGINIDKFSTNSDMFSSDNRCGFTVGATAEYIVPAVGVGFDVSLMYSQLSTTSADKDLTAVKVKTGNFLEIPLHLKYQLSIPAISKILAPYIYTGPSVAFKFGGNNDYFTTNKTQWGWDLGLGVTLIKHLQIGAGYTWGMNKVAKWAVPVVVNGAQVDTTNEIKVRNNYWTVTAAWMF